MLPLDVLEAKIVEVSLFSWVSAGWGWDIPFLPPLHPLWDHQDFLRSLRSPPLPTASWGEEFTPPRSLPALGHPLLLRISTVPSPAYSRGTRGAKPIFLGGFQPSCNFRRTYFPPPGWRRRMDLLPAQPGGGGLEEPPSSCSGGFVTTLPQRSEAGTSMTPVLQRPALFQTPGRRPFCSQRCRRLQKRGFLLRLWVTGFVFSTWSDRCRARLNSCMSLCRSGARNDDETRWSVQGGAELRLILMLSSVTPSSPAVECWRW